MLIHLTFAAIKADINKGTFNLARGELQNVTELVLLLEKVRMYERLIFFNVMLRVCALDTFQMTYFVKLFKLCIFASGTWCASQHTATAASSHGTTAEPR